MTPAPNRAERFQPHAVREMASMFDQVSPRYDLLNRLMTLGQDVAWRRAMWRAVPERARAVLDLCTGSGASLTGLRRPGRLVLGVDVSLAMLEQAAAEHGRLGWAPRLACASAFRLPLRGQSLDAITIAFGARNLRPLEQALAEMARVLKPGGILSVLEAVSPRPGPLAPLHRFHLRHVIPLLGRLSPEPDAYRYLSESIFEFGAGPEFERAIGASGFLVEGRRSFLFGAARLWVATQGRAHPTRAAGGEAAVQPARAGGNRAGDLPQGERAADREQRWWSAAQLAVSAALLVSLVVVLWVFIKSSDRLPLDRAARSGAALLLIAGTLFSAARTVVLTRRLLAPPSRR